MIPHRAIVRTVRHTNFVDITPQDSIAHAANVGFDASLFEIWGALLNGARLVILPHDLVLAPQSCREVLRRERVTILIFATALFNMYAQYAPDAFQTLKVVMFGGESANAEAVRRVLTHHPPLRLVNGYGPTESTTFTTWYDIHQVPPGATSIPIGRPLAHSEVYLLDAHLQPVPVGVHGEIYIGGEGLALGYLRRPELTAARFIAHPFSNAPGARLYRTGDIARYLPSGDLEFLSRVDHQVKIRGFRVEPGEVEAVPRQHTRVRAAFVRVHATTSGEKRLLAYLVVEADDALAAIEAYARERLPRYMVPASFIPVAALPLTANGKVDIRALPLPDGARKEVSNAIAAGDEVECRLIAIFEDLLALRPVGVDDDFFLLGGHSLLLMSLVQRIEREFGCSLPLAALFQTSTVSHIARLIRQARDMNVNDQDRLRHPAAHRARPGSEAHSGAIMNGNEQDLSCRPERSEGSAASQQEILRSAQDDDARPSSLLQIQAGIATRPAFYAVHPLDGEVVCYGRLAAYLGEAQSFYGVRAPAICKGQNPSRSMEDMVALYVKDLLCMQPRGPYLLGGWSYGGVVAFEMARQLKQQGQEVALLALIDSYVPRFNLRDEDEDAAFAHLLKDLERIFTTERENILQSAGIGEAPLHLPHPLLSVLMQLKHAGAMPQGQNGTARTQTWLCLLASRLLAYQRYVPRKYTGRICLFRASEQDTIARQDDYSGDETLGWGRLCTEPVEILKVPGTHMSMVTEPHVRALAGQLSFCIERAL